MALGECDATNSYLTPGGGFMSLAVISRPAECVYLAELAENRTGDHLHPMAWRPLPRSTLDPRAEVATRRHQEAASYLFVDGHAKALRFEQTWSPPGRNWWFPGP